MPSLIPPEIASEIGNFQETVRKFRAGEVAQDTFQRFRLQHGVYGQRQEGVQMIRIKIPLGMLNSEQIEAVADLAETYAGKNAHVTTRQDIQIHYVKIENCPPLLKRLAEVRLTTREACGNTVRNVTASPSAGVDPQEAFDVTPYAHAFAYHLLRNPVCQTLPRKFKVAFDGGGLFTAIPLIHEIGLIARVRGVGASQKRGFEVFVGGGLGSYPKVAQKIIDFLPVEDLLRFGEAVLRVFDRYGERKVRMKARMKFLIEKIGFEKFAELVLQEIAEVKLDSSANDYLNDLDRWNESPPLVCDADIPDAEETAEFLAWKKTNVRSQRQSGYSMVELRLVTGDMKPDPMRQLADILRRYAGGKVRTMVHQNLLIRWVRDRDLPALYHELQAIGMASPDAQTIYDVTACPGTDSCRLGISSSMGLARAIEARLYQEDGRISSTARALRIKISGCPNSCGQHHIANIGFYGGAIPQNGHTLPAFQLMLGGSYGRETVIAAPIGQIPSKNVPEAVVRLVRHFVEKRGEGESFNDFYGGMKKEKVLQFLGDLTKAPTYQERPDFYVDWEEQGEFKLQKGVIGECAGQVVAEVIPKVADGETALQTARALLGHGEFESASYKAYEAMVKAADALLYYRLVQTFTDVETTHEFENHFAWTAILPQWKGFHKEIQALRKRPIDEALAKDWLDRAERFVKSCLEKEGEVAASSPRKGKKPTGPTADYLAI